MATLKNPVGGVVQVTHRLPVALRDRLAMYSTAARLSQQDVLCTALSQYLDEVDPAGKFRPIVQATPGDALQDRMGRLEEGVAELGRLIQNLGQPTHPRRK